MPPRLSLHDFHSLATEHGFEWIGPYTGSQGKTRWRCLTCKCEWDACYSDLRRKPSHLGCPGCYQQRRRQHGHNGKYGREEYAALEQETGWTHDDDLPENTHTKSYWICPGRDEACELVRHRQLKTYDAIRQGDGCVFCSGLAPKTPEDFHALAERRSWTWTGPAVENNHTKTGWVCENGHALDASYDNVHAEMGCRSCHPTAPRKLPSDYEELAEAASLEWLGPEVASVLEPTRWRCRAQGHDLENTYYNTKRNHERGLGGCPVCEHYINGARVSRPQLAVAEAVHGVVNAPVGPYRVDVLVEREGRRIAIEYDCWYWHAGLTEHDAEKTRVLREEGLRVLRIRTNMQIPAAEELERWIALLARGPVEVLVVTLPDWGIGPRRDSRRP